MTTPFILIDTLLDSFYIIIYIKKFIQKKYIITILSKHYRNADYFMFAYYAAVEYKIFFKTMYVYVLCMYMNIKIRSPVLQIQIKLC